MNREPGIRHEVFWPPLLLLAAGLVTCLAGGASAVQTLREATRWCVQALSVPLAWTALGALFLCMIVAASPLGKVRLGGPESVPMFTRWQYFSIALCTTVAVGILFWATAEPLFHLTAPPLGLTPLSPEAARFSMSTLLLHWTVIPYALYAVPAVLFALAFYNLGRPFSLSSCLFPLFGDRGERLLATPVDVICLYALVAGMAASLGAGILTLGGGLEHLTGLDSNPLAWVLIGLAVVVTFVGSAVAGLDKGIRRLSDINTRIFLALLLAIALLGPAGNRLALTLTGVWDLAVGLVPRSLLVGFSPGDSWPLDWTLFNWTNWLAWAPVTALFLGRISRGYTVREMLLFILVLPSLFVTVWMGVLGGSALALEAKRHELAGLLANQGPESISYAIFQTMPLGWLFSAVFVGAVFISYVTAADSNTMAMAGLSSSGISPESPEPPTTLKCLWGGIVGLLAVVMVCSSGVDGVKVLSNLGGIPALFFEILAATALLRLCWSSCGRSGR